MPTQTISLSVCCLFSDFCKPASLILPQDILSLAEARLSQTSSAAVCRKLSSVGRRVLSIESVSNFQGCPRSPKQTAAKAGVRCDFSCLFNGRLFLSPSADGQEGSWEARWQHSRPRCLLKRLSSDDNTKDLPDSSVKSNGVSRQQVL